MTKTTKIFASAQEALELVVSSKNEMFLLEANRRVIARIKSLRSIKSLEAIGFFKRGDAVEWENSRTRTRMKGIITDIRTKKVCVEVKEGTNPGNWVVPATMLQKAK